MTVTEFIDKALNTVTEIYENPNYEDYHTWDKLSAWELKDYINDHLLVIVNRGRKWKGTGYLIGWEQECNIYYRTTTNIAMVYDPVENVMHRVTAAMVSPHPSYKENYKGYIEYLLRTKYNKESMLPRNFQIDFHESFKYFLHLCKNFTDLPKVHDLRCPEDDARIAKLEQKKAEFKRKKFPELVRWAESKGKVGEEAIALAEKVWEKRYA